MGIMFNLVVDLIILVIAILLSTSTLNATVQTRYYMIIDLATFI